MLQKGENLKLFFTFRPFAQIKYSLMRYRLRMSSKILRYGKKYTRKYLRIIFSLKDWP